MEYVLYHLTTLAVVAVFVVLLLGLVEPHAGPEPQPEPEADALARRTAVRRDRDHHALRFRPLSLVRRPAAARARRSPCAKMAACEALGAGDTSLEGPPSRMVVLNKIYTKTGDAGTTALGSGERVPKHALRIAAYGTVDETNASVGMARVHLGAGHLGLDGKLVRIQNDLFDLGADLCVPDRGEKPKHEPLRVSEAQVKRLEDEIDEMNAELQPAALVRAAGRSSGRRGAARRAHRLPARRAADGGARRPARRARRRAGAQVHQPPVRFPVRRQPLRQRPRQERCALGARTEPIARMVPQQQADAQCSSPPRRELAQVDPLPVRHRLADRAQCAGVPASR